jgi:hypothetical protein
VEEREEEASGGATDPIKEEYVDSSVAEPHNTTT